MVALLYHSGQSSIQTMIRSLHQYGIQVDTCTDRKRFLYLSSIEDYTAIIFQDLSFEELRNAVKEWRETVLTTSRLIALTRSLSATDRGRALECGVHTYHIYPYSYARVLQEILSHSFSVLREEHGRSTVETRLFRIDFLAHEIHYQDQRLPVTHLQFRLLCLFVRYRGKTLSRTHLWEEVWGDKEYTLSNAIDVQVGRLRSLLGDPKIIETVYGLGYRMREDV